MDAARRRTERGFSLVELMISVAIIGALASVALPQMERAQLRARAAERKTVLNALGRALTDTISIQNKLPTNPRTNPWIGADNPPGAPGKQKRVLDWKLAGWTSVPMVIQGDCYYTYSFTAEDPGGTGDDLTVTIVSTGDLDGDGDPSVKTLVYKGVGYAFDAPTETPPAGQEDVGVF
jgi:prepilin-type N-terminal cleavage/methylation domain-containing protein